MSGFRQLVLMTEEDPEVDTLLQRVKFGSAIEREGALSALIGRARQSGNPDSWNTVGVGFHFAEQNDRAIEVHSSLVRDFPQEDQYRLNLATFYSQTGQIDLCRLNLRHIAEHGVTEELRRIGREQLEGYEEFVGITEQDLKLKDLQIKALRSAIQRLDCTPEDFNTLARLLVRRSKIEPRANIIAEAISVLEKGLAKFPRNVDLLEFLIGCLLHAGEDTRLRTALAELEEVAPDSMVLELATTLEDEEAVKFSQQLNERTHRLLDLANSNDVSVREAALQDLARIVESYPKNPWYRINYAFALMSCGKKAAALGEARKLEDMHDVNHSFHFNLGQVLWICGDPAKGRFHLDLALQHAKDEQERQDVYERIADLENINDRE